MKRETPFANDKLEQFSWRNLLYSNDAVDTRVQRMKKIVRVAVENELTQKQHQCITMRYIEDLPVKEIAVRMGIKPTTVYKHLKKAIAVLKKCSLYL